MLYGDDPVVINAGKDVIRLRVSNTGDRPVQVGSHYHFFETNRALRFEREAARGMRLNVPAGTAVRFEPGDVREVELVAFGGERRVIGFSGALEPGPAPSPGGGNSSLFTLHSPLPPPEGA